MARYFIIGAADEDGFWLVDTQERSVEPIGQLAGSTVAQTEALAALRAQQHSGPYTRGVAVAIATEDRPHTPSHELFAPHGGLASHELFIDHPV